VAELEGKHSTGLTALGILSVLLGALLFLGSFWGLLQPGPLQRVAEEHQVPQVLRGLGLAWTFVDAGGNVLLAALLFAAGVGLLKLRRWGGRLAVTYAVARIAWSVVALVLAFIGPYANLPEPEQLDPGAAASSPVTLHLIAATLIVAAFALSVVFAVILLCLLSRKSYRDRLV